MSYMSLLAFSEILLADPWKGISQPVQNLLEHLTAHPLQPVGLTGLQWRPTASSSRPAKDGAEAHIQHIHPNLSGFKGPETPI
jgi:hypothetical protein